MNTFKTLSIALVIMMSSCASLRSDYTQGEDDVYHSKKDTRKNNAVYVPEVDVNEIIRQHPPQYGDSAVNRIDESDRYINPNAAAGYPAYKAQQDSLYALYPWLSGYYVSTTPPPFDEREMQKQARREARRLRREQYLYNSYAGYGYGSYYGNGWNNGFYGNGWNNGFYGNSLSFGFGNGFYGNNWNSWGYPYYNNWNSGLSFGWNSNLGWNWGLGFNNGWNNWGYNPYSYWGSSWNSPWYSPWYNSWGYPYYYPYYYGDGGHSGSNATERQRGSMGSTNPPNRLSNEAQGGGNRMTPPPTAGSGTATPPTAPGAARLEQRNGQTYYIPPAQNRDRQTPAYGTYNRSVDRAEVQNEYYRPPVQQPTNTYQRAPQNRSDYRNDNNYARPPQQQAPPTYQRNNTFPSAPSSPAPSAPSAPSGPRVGGGGGGGQRPR